MPGTPIKRLYSVADAEPDSFFVQDATSAFALNLSCEVEADPGDDGDYSEAERTDAQTFFDAFLEAIVSKTAPLKFLLVSAPTDPSLPGVDADNGAACAGRFGDAV